MPALRDLVALGRFDRPVGAWLLFWPCAWGLALYGRAALANWQLFAWFALGALVMRGAGCAWNDLLDRKLDAKVARTANRPVAAGRVSPRAALIFSVALSLVGLVVLLQLNGAARLVALAAIPLVALYPLMKRITFWPQAWLGLTFSWGALVGSAALDPGLARLPETLLLYAAGIFWTLGYDSIYAAQDLEDDALAGVKSSARALGSNLRAGVSAFYALSLACLAAALWRLRPDPLVFLLLVPAAVHLARQAWRSRAPDPALALALFRSSTRAGALIFAAVLVAAL